MKDLIEKMKRWFVVRFSSCFWVLSECGTEKHDFKVCPYCKMSVIPDISKGVSRCWNCKKILCSFDDEPDGYRSGYFYTGTKSNRTEFYLKDELHNHLIWRSLFLTPLILWVLLVTLFDFSFSGHAFGLDESFGSMMRSVSSYFYTNSSSNRMIGLFFAMTSFAIISLIVIIGKKMRFTKASIGVELWSLAVIPMIFVFIAFVSISITKPAIIPIWSNDYTEIMTKSEAVAYIDKKALVEMEELVANEEWKKAGDLADKMFWFAKIEDVLFADIWRSHKRDIVKKAVLVDFANAHIFSSDVGGVFETAELVKMLVEYLYEVASNSEFWEYCNSSFFGITTPFVLAQDYSKPLLEICKSDGILEP